VLSQHPKDRASGGALLVCGYLSCVSGKVSSSLSCRVHEQVHEGARKSYGLVSRLRMRPGGVGMDTTNEKGG